MVCYTAGGFSDAIILSPLFLFSTAAGKRSLSSKATIEEEDVLSDIEAGETPLPARHHSDSGGMSGRQMFNLKCTPTAKHGEN